MKTLILGLGSPSQGDAHVGLEVARTLHALLEDPDVDIIEMPASGFDLLELVAGYDKAVVVDCIRVSEGEVGELRRLGLDDLELVSKPPRGRGSEYRAKVELARTHAGSTPREISIYAIEVGDCVVKSADLAEIMREAVPRLVAQIAREEFGATVPESDWY
jgi:hydrogenase maturation protease